MPAVTDHLGGTPASLSRHTELRQDLGPAGIPHLRRLRVPDRVAPVGVVYVLRQGVAWRDVLSCTKHYVIVDRHRAPPAVSLTGGNRHDVTQLIPLLDAIAPIRGPRGRPDLHQSLLDLACSIICLRRLR
ncbi:hypothetical protein [Streptomyces mirabilis]